MKPAASQLETELRIERETTERLRALLAAFVQAQLANPALRELAECHAKSERMRSVLEEVARLSPAALGSYTLWCRVHLALDRELP